MRIKEIIIYSYKGISNITIKINESVNFLVSDNNVGKTRVLEAINAFYCGKESGHIGIKYELLENEKEILRKNLEILQQEEDILVDYNDKTYTIDGKNSKKLMESDFFGEVIYIPAVSDHQNETDISKTSTQISKAISKLIEKNSELNEKINILNEGLRKYITSINSVTKSQIGSISNEMLFSNIELKLYEKSFDNNEIIKNNIQLKANENGSEISINQLGTGVQRNIVNSILEMSKIDGLNIILYDEPETFLNVKLQRNFIANILSNIGNNQYIVATHSPDIIYRNDKVFSSIVKLKKDDCNVKIFQYDDDEYRRLIKETNKKLFNGNDDRYILKEDINKTMLAWWDRSRINALFEDKLLIVEGPTEEIIIDMLLKKQNIVYVSSCSGKFAIPYLIILFKNIFGIETYCLCDKDNGENNHKIFNQYIKDEAKGSVFLENDIESELGYSVASTESHRKPQIFLEKYFDAEIDKEKIENFKNKIKELWNI